MWNIFFSPSNDTSLFVATAYDAKLVALSILMAIAMAALSLHIVSLAQRSVDPRLRHIAVLSGALVLGIGVWSMHFIGMLSLRLCATVSYDLPLTLLSVLPGLFAAWTALRLLMGEVVSNRQLLASGVMVGLGIGAMHYLGMQAMQMTPMLRYQAFWFVLSLCVAVVLATVALGINCSGYGKRFGHWPRIGISGAVMGSAISGMHYAAMRAAVFVGAPEYPQPIAPHGTAQLTQAITLGMLFLSLSVIGVNVFARYRELLRLAEMAHKEMADALAALKVSEMMLEQRVSDRTQSLRQSHAAMQAMTIDLQAALRDSDALLSTLNMHAIVSVADSAGTITETNDAFCAISGYRREELISQSHRIVNSGLHPESFWVDMWRTIQSGTPWRGEICNRSKNGAVYWVDTFIAPFVGADGQIEKYVSIRTDISRLKANEQELMSHRDRLADLVRLKTADLEHTVALSQRTLAELEQQRFVIDEHAIVTVCGVDGRIRYGNDKFCQTSGYSREEFLGQDHNILNSAYHPKGFFKNMYDTLARGEVWHAEICNRAKDGSLYWVESTTAAFLDESGKPREYIAVHTNVTERKRAEEAAHAASRAKSDFLANMSHEIRTPMNGVIGMVDILMQTEWRPEQRHMLGTVHESSLTLLNIINDILDYSKIEAGKLEVENIPVHLPHLAESVVKLLNSVSSVKAIDLSAEVSPDLPRWVLGDPNRLRQVLLNLLGNALKFTDSSSSQAATVRLQVSPVVLEEGEAGFSFCVRDNGIGMSEDLIAKLFQPFTQADGSTARRFGGTGLGLSITQRLVELMHGEILVQSRLGQGSEFTVCLPLRVCPENDGPQTEPNAISPPVQLGGRRAPTCEQALALGQLILIAEDNETNREVMQEQLRLIGYACEVALDGAQALQMWQAGLNNGQSRYALLLTDCHMPILDGFGLTKAIRSQEAQGRRLPIIAITANAMQGESRRCLALGMDDYLSKPLRLNEMAAKLAQWLPRNSLSDLAALAPTPEVRLLNLEPVNASEQFPIWNPLTLATMVGDNPATHRRLIDKFLLNSEQQVAHAKLASWQRDAHALAEIAHALKSGARSVGALAMGELCQTLESSGREGDIDKCTVVVAGLVEAFAKVVEHHDAAKLYSV